MICKNCGNDIGEHELADYVHLDYMGERKSGCMDPWPVEEPTLLYCYIVNGNWTNLCPDCNTKFSNQLGDEPDAEIKVLNGDVMEC